MKSKKQIRFYLIFLFPYFLSVGGCILIGFLLGGYTDVQERYMLGLTPLVGIALSNLGRWIADKNNPR